MLVVGDGAVGVAGARGAGLDSRWVARQRDSGGVPALSLHVPGSSSLKFVNAAGASLTAWHAGDLVR